jgi:ABC-type protease/lipase transport system fused ATPase/permease subunit
MSIILGLGLVVIMEQADISDGVIIASAVLMAAWGITDKLVDIRFRLTEVRDAIKNRR